MQYIHIYTYIYTYIYIHIVRPGIMTADGNPKMKNGKRVIRKRWSHHHSLL